MALGSFVFISVFILSFWYLFFNACSLTVELKIDTRLLKELSRKKVYKRLYFNEMKLLHFLRGFIIEFFFIQCNVESVIFTGTSAMYVDSLEFLGHICKWFQSSEYSLNMIKNIVKLIQSKALITLLHLSITFF